MFICSPQTNTSSDPPPDPRGRHNPLSPILPAPASGPLQLQLWAWRALPPSDLSTSRPLASLLFYSKVTLSWVSLSMAPSKIIPSAIHVSTLPAYLSLSRLCPALYVPFISSSLHLQLPEAGPGSVPGRGVCTQQVLNSCLRSGCLHNE